MWKLGEGRLGGLQGDAPGLWATEPLPERESKALTQLLNKRLPVQQSYPTSHDFCNTKGMQHGHPCNDVRFCQVFATKLFGK
jgi:hypothetical protein